MNIVVFSRDRAMQLDLFLRSFARFAAQAGEQSVRVLYTWSNEEYRRGYDRLIAGTPPNVGWIRETRFKADLLAAVDPRRPFTVFFADDNVFTRPFTFAGETTDLLDRCADVLCTSLRLHKHLTYCYTRQLALTPPEFGPDNTYAWRGQNGDYGYPMSVDGHVFRTADILPRLAGLDFFNPNTLEAALARAPLDRPKMACREDAALVNLPVNRVQTSIDNLHGGIGADWLNARFLEGKRLDLEPLVDGRYPACHVELPLALVDDPRGGPPAAGPAPAEAVPSAAPAGGPAVSIVVCMRNAAAHVRGCLDSVCGQTLRDIEIICVDNASTDGTPDILVEYQRRDARIRVMALPEDRGLMQSRKVAVAAATGNYIQFLDADDVLELDACEILVRLAREQAVEILHFGSRVEPVGAIPADEIARVEKFIAPYPGRLEGADVFRACFRDGKYQFTIWNKLFDAGLCKRAFGLLPDGHVVMAEDLFAFFAIAFLARSYMGVGDARAHRYRFGGGLTGGREYPWERFVIQCGQAAVVRGLRGFLEQQGAWTEHWPVHDRILAQLAEGCAWAWLRRLPAADQARGFDLLVECWGASAATAALAKLPRDSRPEIARGLHGARSLAQRPRPLRTIGTYYRRLRNGGLERVISMLIPLWRSLGCNVVLFTDEPPHADDYRLPEGVKRVALGTAAEALGGNPRPRAEQWPRLLAEHGIDILVYHEWVDWLLLPDLLAAKCAGVPFVVVAHGVFSFLLLNNPPIFAALPATFALADAVVGLSRIDRQYWAAFAPRAYYLPNPLPAGLGAASVAALDAAVVVWVGRISAEKNPLDAVRILAALARRVPAARLWMVGKGEDARLDAALAAEIERLGVGDRVELCGYHREVEPYYERAAVYLSTSSFEGFSMTLAEAKAHGLPCVMYDIPHLELVRAGGGIRTVPQGDVEAAAAAIADLLEHPSERQRLGRAARAAMTAQAGIDLAAGWREILEAVAAGEPPAPVAETEETMRILLRTLLEHYRLGRLAGQEAGNRHAAWTAKTTAQRDAARERVARLTARVADLTRQRDVRQARVELLKESLARARTAAQREHQAAVAKLKQRLQDQRARFEKSLSWRLTAPLRRLGRDGGRGA